jgi:sterol desaturase/sphingolipid hydroxylase (fatty acid hydroxylase superfamily)
MPQAAVRESWLLAHEPLLRFASFAGLLALLAAWERLAPRRPLAVGRARRWPANLGLAALSALALQVTPLAAVGLAAAGEARGTGLLPLLGLRGWAGGLAALILLDLAIYAQHVLFHKLPALWRLHRVHHADLDLDVSTGVRFHPGEIALSLALKLGAVAALGPPAAAVLLFEIGLNASALFHHSNASLPPRLDRALRWLWVTPDMHLTHHSCERAETDSCYGFALTWWDHLFGTYRAAPAAGRERAVIGLREFRDPRELRLGALLLQPLRAPGGEPRAAD